MNAKGDRTTRKVVPMPKRKKADPSRHGGIGAHGRSVDESDEAVLRWALDFLKSVPDVREDKVAEIRRRIREGTYRIDALAIAERLLKSHLDMDD